MSHSQRSLKELSVLVKDSASEGRLYDEMCALRERYSPQLVDAFAFDNGPEAISWSHQALNGILGRVLEICDPSSGDPGHGPGHWCRDYIHAMRLAHDPELDPKYIPAAILGGTLHDIGTLFLDRYADKVRALRHAEAGALIVRAAAIENGMRPEQADLIAYVIAAHTHYRVSTQIVCADGVTRSVDPYPSEAADGSPYLEVWLPRWADRLDCSGPCMIARNYLTLARDHDDFNGDGYYTVAFADHLRPLLRSPEEIKADGGRQTMLEHMRMFAQSQSNASPYGKHDRGVMVKLRDLYREWLEEIIAHAEGRSEQDEEFIMLSWYNFLRTNIEPSTGGCLAANSLDMNFFELDAETRQVWARIFHWTMRRYVNWSHQTMQFLQSIPAEYRRLPMFPDIAKIIQRY